jgi:putative ABC transport system permease protein
MRAVDRFQVSLRHVRGRMVESILVIVATAIGVALVAAMAAFIRSYNNQTEELLSHPAYRELLVEAVGNESELDEPVVAYDADSSSEVSLGFADIQAVVADASSIAYGYLAEGERLSTRLPGAGGFGGGPEGGPDGFAPPPDFGTVTPDAAGALPNDPAAGVPATVDSAAAGPRTDGSPPPDDTAADGPFADLRDQFRQARESGRELPEFDLEQFFGTDPDVLTELPLETFSGLRVTSSFLLAYGLSIAEGSGFADEDIESGNQVIVLGSDLADTLFPDGDAVGTRVRLNLQTYTVVGVLAASTLRDPDTGASYNDLAYVPNGAAQVNFGGRTVRMERGTRTLRFAVANSADLESAAAELEAHFDTEYGNGAVRITAPLEELRTEREKLSRILAVVLFLAAAGLFIASINLFNLMLMRVIRRTRGIGISRAMGASRREIVRQFLNESALMSLFGTVLGLIASPFVFRMLQSVLVEETVSTSPVSWAFLLLGAAAAFLFSVLFGVYPAEQAGRIDAAVAIRTE